MIGLIIISLQSCISPKQTNLLQVDRDPHYVPKTFEDYRLQANDEIYCTILTSNTELANAFNNILTSTEIASTNTQGSANAQAYTVYENGNISIPFFGDINVLGMTVAEAEFAVQQQMRNSAPDAQVRIRLRNNIYYVVSDSKNGMFNMYKDNMTIYQAIAISGNPPNVIDLSKVKIVRTEKDGRQIVKTFDLRTEFVIESEFYYIKPNDVIYYSTSSSSFFRVTSFTSLITTIITPLTFMLSMIAIRF